jgi:hypothetical protein
MPKSDKATIAQRVDDVTNLLVAGAEFANLRQFASAHGWGVSDRQIRRYMKVAYRQMAKAARRDRQQLLGLHLKKRRALYARCVKANENRTALQVIRDEAALQGLYPPTKTGPATGDGQQPFPDPSDVTVSIRIRAARYVSAEMRNDQVELRLLEKASIYRTYLIADTNIASEVLNTMTNLYVKEQFGHAANYFYANCRDMATNHALPAWNFSMNVCAYQFWVNREGWNKFAEWLGVKGDDLVAINARDFKLTHGQEMLCALAPSADELLALAEQASLPPLELVTPEHHAKMWRQMFSSVCPEQSAG